MGCLDEHSSAFPTIRSALSSVPQSTDLYIPTQSHSVTSISRPPGAGCLRHVIHSIPSRYQVTQPPEGLESKPYELKSDDIVEIGIGVVSAKPTQQCVLGTPTPSSPHARNNINNVSSSNTRNTALKKTKSLPLCPDLRLVSDAHRKSTAIPHFHSHKARIAPPGDLRCICRILALPTLNQDLPEPSQTLGDGTYSTSSPKIPNVLSPATSIRATLRKALSQNTTPSSVNEAAGGKDSWRGGGDTWDRVRKEDDFGGAAAESDDDVARSIQTVVPHEEEDDGHMARQGEHEERNTMKKRRRRRGDNEENLRGRGHH
ncbi:hypothetical protein PILCRDRAFT_13990 [Piloderma croceum F 1598]|uniref:Uncharacterized protein n=1 Tax=Piloderma croceum (strain F 1598) TaxID=765440 RepID=A0A0C3F4U7_PILCF|nr:hypothetical protein PILCRDRAFT_13990 [Piloderma croceum F 1598]